MKAQFTLTVPSGKALIAEAVIRLPEVRHAFSEQRILLKGGTTVSAISERLASLPLRLSGRVTKRGTVYSLNSSKKPHSLLIDRGTPINIDDAFMEAAEALGPGDIVIIGANIIDTYGNAAIMAGACGGGIPGKGFTYFMSEGVNVIIPAGLEKLIPGSISHSVQAAGRKSIDVAYGMAVGLIPLIGKVFTELDAFSMFGKIKTNIIGRGGLEEAAGATTYVIEGEVEEVRKVLRIVDSIRNAATSCEEGSLQECKRGSPGCSNHLACLYKTGGSI